MQVRKVTIGVLSVVAALAATNNLFAQNQGQGRRGGPMGEGVRLRVLALPAVQEDLKLTDEQKAKGRQAVEGLQGLFGGLQNASQEERQQKFQEIQTKTRAAIEEVNKVLSKEQNERLDQIVLQARGSGALADEKLAGDLKLTDDQKQKLRDIQQRTGQQMRELQQGEQEKRMQILKTAGEEALAVLSAEQKEQFEKMKGAKIDLPENFGFGGGRRPQQ
jgi:hypothetical protein